MLKGSCMCGEVAYEAEGPLIAMARCHCVQCRKASGAEFATNGTVLVESFRVTKGGDLLSRYESSPGTRRVFCGRCGSPLFKEDDKRPGQVRLRLGCVDEGIDQKPMFHVFVSEKPAWSDIFDDTPQFERAPG
ncbi:MAG TPA: GFA family protein, partial [Polyangiaceae bacterium]|nr:GFA family protein [Polyangiaceae bacterium]